MSYSREELMGVEGHAAESGAEETLEVYAQRERQMNKAFDAEFAREQARDAYKEPAPVRHSSVSRLLRVFDSQGTPAMAAYKDLAELLANLAPNPEVTVALRKLVESRDAYMRAIEL